jgi:N-methylhydantoinase A/oxoprolinase/acetone carboxylase beta subunit
MTELELTCPLTIVTGDGKVIDPSDVLTRSGQTVASGPACSALFGARSSSEARLVVDVGGTTTDIALTENEAPVLSKNGCTIGSWVTHMPSVDMYTGGIGGDSLVTLAKDGTVSFGPTRVIPLAMDDTIINPDQWLGLGDRSRGISLSQAAYKETTDEDGQIIDFIAETGTTTFHDLRRLAVRDRISVSRQLEQLTRENKIREHGFTPTDALHVLGLADFGNREKAENGAALLAAHVDMEVESFCRMIVEKTEDRIVSLILEYVINRTWGNTLAHFLSTYQDHPLLDTGFSLKIPLIGVGAASSFFLPGVARKLSTTVFLPDNHEIGNAVGAAGTILKKDKKQVVSDDPK